MTEFYKPYFEQLMVEAVRLHNQGQYESALALSTEAYEIAPDNSFEKGRAARDNSARYDRLGMAADAEEWAMMAYQTHDGLVKTEGPTREALRERAVTAMYVGVSGLRKAMVAKRNGQAIDASALSFMKQTWSDIAQAKAQAEGINQKVDQYEINAARRVSIAESLLGDRKKGLAIGARAVGLAFMSESPRLDTTNPNLTTIQRLRAKTKALIGSVAAVGVGILATPKPGRRHNTAWSLADRTL